VCPVLDAHDPRPAQSSIRSIRREDAPMPLWKLEPIDAADRSWDASTYKGEVIVRADDEKRARRLAVRAFGIATRVVLGESIKLVPWDTSAVRCTEVPPTDDYTSEGEPGIVYPPKAVSADGS
jgi:hypothetical protein